MSNGIVNVPERTGFERKGFLYSSSTITGIQFAGHNKDTNVSTKQNMHDHYAALNRLEGTFLNATEKCTSCC